MPYEAGRIPLCGHIHLGSTLSFELRISGLQEDENFLRHVGDVCLIDESETELQSSSENEIILKSTKW
jgi:hypothetical protein